MEPKDPQRLPSGDIHPAFVKATLAARGLTLTDLAKRHRKHSSYFRVALSARLAKPLRIIARAIGRRPHEVWPTLFDERDRTIKARRTTRSTPKVPTSERRRSHRAAA